MCIFVTCACEFDTPNVASLLPGRTELSLRHISTLLTRSTAGRQACMKMA